MKTRNPLAAIFAEHYAHGRVISVTPVTPTMVSVRIESAAVENWDYAPGQHVRIQINDPLSLYGILRPVETLRTYTIWDVSSADRTFELRAHLFDGGGIGRDWFLNVHVGDDVTYWGPQGDLRLRDADHYLFAGDETGACGFAPLLREIPATKAVYGFSEAATAADHPPLPGPHELGRVARDGASAVSSRVLIDAVRRLDLPQAGHTIAYLAGEARTCQAIRTHLIRDRGWHRTNIVTKPFWTPGKRGLHH